MLMLNSYDIPSKTFELTPVTISVWFSSIQNLTIILLTLFLSMAEGRGSILSKTSLRERNSLHENLRLKALPHDAMKLAVFLRF